MASEREEIKERKDRSFRLKELLLDRGTSGLREDQRRARDASFS